MRYLRLPRIRRERKARSAQKLAPLTANVCHEADAEAQPWCAESRADSLRPGNSFRNHIALTDTEEHLNEVLHPQVLELPQCRRVPDEILPCPQHISVGDQRVSTISFRPPYFAPPIAGNTLRQKYRRPKQELWKRTSMGHRSGAPRFPTPPAQHPCHQRSGSNR